MAAQNAFSELGLNATIDAIVSEMQALYLSDDIPWVVGYSGGKDSTATLQLVWLALERLEAGQRHKPVYVISTDTLVENPVVASWVSNSLRVLGNAAHEQGLPITAHRLTPDVKNTFWVNLIGKGYPAPRPKFRWCTERLKIQPSTAFIRDVVADHGEAILVLGTRKSESAARARVMDRFEQKRVRDKLSPNGDLPNSYVYSPIEDWSNDDVWLFLMQVKNPWGHNNKDLLTMYQGASEDGECPLVVDTSTPSCGDSRFGCWVCTLVEKDKSMQAMIQNDQEKEWMLPLLELRNELDVTNDHDQRDFRRMSGRVQLYNKGQPIPGPYTQTAREKWLRKLLEAQEYVREHGPLGFDDIELISLDELDEIRRIWVYEKNELEDSLPFIYEEVTKTPYPGKRMGDRGPFGRDEVALLKKITQDDPLHFELVRELIAIESRQRSMLRRGNIFKQIASAFARSAFDSPEEAIERARRMSGEKYEEEEQPVLTLEEIADSNVENVERAGS